jgi:hypothetical protein
MSEIKETEVVTSSAPLEPTISTQHNYTDMLYLDMENGTLFNDAVASVVTSRVQHTGRIDLVKLSVVYIATASGQTLRAGICNTGQNLSAEAVSMKPNGISFVSNNMTMGVKHTGDIVPEDTISRQLFPVSSFLPSARFIISKDAGMRATVIIQVKVEGVRQYYGTL